MISIAIVDDDLSDIDSITKCLDSYKKENNFDLSYKTYTSANAFLKEYESFFDIVLLDIEMPELNGIDLAKKIREIDKFVVIVFITNIAKYAIKGYEVEAYDYILKPVNKAVLNLKLNKLFKKFERKNDGSIVFNYGNSTIKIEESEIKYFEVSGHYLTIHTNNASQKEYKIYSTLKKYKEQLNSTNFAYCNRCYYVNLKYVKEVYNNYCILVTSEGEEPIKLLISRPQKRNFIKALVRHTIGKSR